MGTHMYLINRDTRIFVEAFRDRSGGKELKDVVDSPRDLVAFLRHCHKHNLKIECVSGFFFDGRDFTNGKERYRKFPLPPKPAKAWRSLAVHLGDRNASASRVYDLWVRGEAKQIIYGVLGVEVLCRSLHSEIIMIRESAT
jgi:hypothetical protein